MEVRVGKELAAGKNKWPKVSSQKRLTVVECWLKQGKEADEKHSLLSYGQKGQLVQSWGPVHSGPRFQFLFCNVLQTGSSFNFCSENQSQFESSSSQPRPDRPQTAVSCSLSYFVKNVSCFFYFQFQFHKQNTSANLVTNQSSSSNK